MVGLDGIVSDAIEKQDIDTLILCGQFITTSRSDDELLSAWEKYHDHPKLKGDYVSIVKGVPNYKDIVMSIISSKGNNTLKEINTIRASVDANAGYYYTQKDIVPISTLLAKTIINRMGNKAFDNQNFYEYKYYNGTALKLAKPIGLVKQKGFWKLADASLDDNTEIIEFMRRADSCKDGSNKYRVRSTKYLSNKEKLIDPYSPIEDKFAESWIYNPSIWTNKLRQVIFNIVDDLNNKGIKAFSESCGSIYNGTAKSNSDTDTTIYLELEDKRILKLIEPLNKKFRKLAANRGLNNNNNYILYSSILGENSRYAYLIPKGTYNPHGDYLFNNYKHGILLYDGLNKTFVDETVKIDIENWRNTNKINIKTK